jgi:hypothetical protein
MIQQFFFSGDSAVYVKPREHQNIIANKSYSTKLKEDYEISHSKKLGLS